MDDGEEGLDLRGERSGVKAVPTQSSAHHKPCFAGYRDQTRPPWDFANRVDPKRDAGGFVNHLVGRGTPFKSAPSFCLGPLPVIPAVPTQQTLLVGAPGFPSRNSAWRCHAATRSGDPPPSQNEEKKADPDQKGLGSALPALSAAGLLVPARLSFAALHQKSRVCDPIFSQN